MRAVLYVYFFVLGMLVCYLLISTSGSPPFEATQNRPEEPAIAMSEYLSFISVMLTTVTVVLASVAIGIGVVAAYTFREIKDEAQKTASKTAREKAEEALSDDVIIARIDEIAFRQKSPGDLAELEEDFDPDDTGER